MFGVSDILKSVDCKTVRILRIQVKQKVWNEAKNRERDWEQTLKIRFFSLASLVQGSHASCAYS